MKISNITNILSALLISLLVIISQASASTYSDKLRLKLKQPFKANTNTLLLNALENSNLVNNDYESNESDAAYFKYLNNEEQKTVLTKRSRYSKDYTLSEEEKKKIDQAAESAFRKLKKFYIVASRSRYGKRDTN